MEDRSRVNRSHDQELETVEIGELNGEGNNQQGIGKYRTSHGGRQTGESLRKER
jgi:hypothetical protein